jgi:predicted MPP superfamily phosphohydrolase
LCKNWNREIARLKVRIAVAIAVLQAFLLAIHWFIYQTWISFCPSLSPTVLLTLRTAILLLAFSFISVTMLGFRFAGRLVTLLYTISALWLGLLNYFFWAACLCRLAGSALDLLKLNADKPLIAYTFFSLALVASLYGLVNARFIRIRRIPVLLPGLPASWRGRSALVISDLHLGHVNGAAFSRRIATLAASLNPDVIFFPGDLFDGGKAEAAALVEPFHALAPPLGSYFSTGNHDEFGNVALYGELLTGVGIRVLANEMVTVDGVEIAGVSHGDSGHPAGLLTILESLQLVPGRASILLNHVPSGLAQVEQAGINLQISGHTHGGQFIPFSWITRRVFGRFTYGLQRFGALQVYTSSGAGTWGPPMRVGTQPEVALLTFV